MHDNPIDQAQIEQFVRQLFQRTGHDPVQWFDIGKQLRRSAEILLPTVTHELAYKSSLGHKKDIFNPQLINVYMLLVGFSVENYLKGIIMARNPDYLPDKKLVLGKEFAVHDMRKLFSLANFDLTDEERTLADRLERATVWVGRYPIPVTVAGFCPPPEPDTVPAPVHYISKPGIRLIEELLNRLEGILLSEIPQERLQKIIGADSDIKPSF